MYKSLTADDYKKHLDMPDDYHVDAMLVAGTWQVDSELERIEKIAKQNEAYVKFQKIPHGFVGIGREILVNKKRIWVFVMYGGTMLSEFLNLGCLFGSKKNVLVGVAGGLKLGIKTADIILPTESYKDGSSSRLYVRDDKDLVASDVNLTARLRSRLSNAHKIYGGKTMTCQAMMAETEEDVRLWSSQGYLAVEMEAATVFAVSKHFGVPAAAVLSVADNLIENETVNSESYVDSAEIRAKVRDEQYRVAIEELFTSE